MQALAQRAGLRLRPHAKTHKSPRVARWQVEAGAVGLCCAKLAEAEAFAASGFADIRLPYPLQPSNADRVFGLLDQGVALSFVVDDADVARTWSAVAAAARRTVDVLVKVDVGFHRCGIDPLGREAAAVVVAVAAAPGLRLRGLLSHAGHAYAAPSDDELRQIARAEVAMLAELADTVRARGTPLEELSVGATPTARFIGETPGPTEMRPGNYVYYDRTQVALGAAGVGDCALTVLSTVVARHGDRVILDAGSKALSSDLIARPGVTGYGAILVDPSTVDAIDESLVMERLSEEHAVVRVTGACVLRPGDRVRILPNHACVVANLADEVWLVAGTDIVDRIPVLARGRTT